VRAVDGVNLTVGEGEFFTLLGPSGCGKTTLLRMIAGFCDLDGGSIRFGTKRIDKLPAHVRDIGMVFQNYAVFPNLTVAGNVAYGLKARKVPAVEGGAPGRGGPVAGPARRFTASVGRTSFRVDSCRGWRSRERW
jgi:ABC-type Fe3+/spermidine/putrescine transport system ATPase subunit